MGVWGFFLSVKFATTLLALFAGGLCWCCRLWSGPSCRLANSQWLTIVEEKKNVPRCTLEWISWLDIRCINEQHPRAGLNIQHKGMIKPIIISYKLTTCQLLIQYKYLQTLRNTTYNNTLTIGKPDVSGIRMVIVSKMCIDTSCQTFIEFLI